MQGDRILFPGSTSESAARARPYSLALRALTRAARIATLTAFAWLSTLHAGPAGNIKRGTPAGGATNSTGTNHRLKGTAGQANAGRTSSSTTSVQIGFWYVISGHGPVGVEPAPTRGPLAFRLDQNAPNPFRDVTRVRFALPREAHVKLRIFDIAGRAIATPIDQTMATGEYTLVFKPRELSSGTYFYELRAGEFVQRKRLVLLR